MKLMLISGSVFHIFRQTTKGHYSSHFPFFFFFFFHFREESGSLEPGLLPHKHFNEWQFCSSHEDI